MSSQNHITSDLNSAQLQAVETLSGPLLILAGAGSGKTKTLTHRIANLVAQGTTTSQILAVTFTNKAAQEMRQRLHKLLYPDQTLDPPRSFMPFMGTFHSICVKILRIEAAAVGLDPNFVIYDTTDQVALIKRIIKNLKISDKSLKPKTVQSIISNCKNTGISPEEYAATAYYPNQKHTAQIFIKFEELKRQAHALDFDDLLLETVNLFANYPEIRQKWSNKFTHILIDEYQDTNKIQYQLIKLLVNQDRNLCVVGDDWQSIYSWRGADFTNILNFERDFPGATVIKLEQNYRSTNNILKASQKIINHNQNRSEKTLFTQAGDGEPVEIKDHYDETAEATWVAYHILDSKQPFQNFAVLYRTNAQSYAFEKAFIAAKIPYKIVGGIRFYDRKEVKDAMAILKLLVNPTDIVSLERVCQNILAGIGAVSLQKIIALTQTTDLKDPAISAQLSAKAKTSFTKLQTFLGQTDLSTPPDQIIINLVKFFNFAELLQDGTAGGEERLANLEVLAGNATTYTNLTDFLADTALMSSADESSAKDSVTLTTIHAAKGLEFSTVFLVGLEEGLFPSSRAESDQNDLEEERRLAYVGMTRARHQLYLSYAHSRFSFGGRNYSSPSRFLIELGYNPYGSNQSVNSKTSDFNDFDAFDEIDPFPEDLPVFE